MGPKKILQKNKTLINRSKGKNSSKRVDLVEESFRKQYGVIKDDFIKLKDDLQKGYDMAKEIVDKKNILGGFMNR